jgi:hypothetical protein
MVITLPNRSSRIRAARSRCHGSVELILAVTLGLAAACSQPDNHQATPAAQAPAVAPPPAAAPPPAQPTTSAATTQPVATGGGTTPAPTAAAPAAVSPAAAPAPKPEPPPAPRFREVTIPAGTKLSVSVLSTLASNTSKVEDPVLGALAEPVVVSGRTALPKGTELSGTITDAKESGRVKGKASIAFRFERVRFDGENYPIQTARVTIEAGQNKGDDVKKGGAGAGLGAIVGGIAGGGTGAAIGAVAGGTGAVMATKGREVEVAPGTVVTAVVQSALTVRVPIK